MIDEARTLLIISGPSQDRSALYLDVDSPMPELTPEAHYKWTKSLQRDLYREEPNEFRKSGLMRQLCVPPEGQTLYDPGKHHARSTRQSGPVRAISCSTATRTISCVMAKSCLIDEFTAG